jgi:hypothetical protein
MKRRRVLALVALLLAGTLAFALADRRWTAGMSSTQAARALEHRLSSTQGARALGLGHTNTDRYTCAADTGAPVPDEPAWTYECADATNSQGSGFFVLTRGDKIAQIQPSG